jgi:hypothetical protein
MKHSPKHLLTALLGVVCFAAAGAQAQKLNDVNVVTVALKLQLQSPGVNSQNGQTRSYAKPVAQTINTKNLLDRLALDKQVQGLYDKNTFPDGAKLALAGDHFVVVKNNNDLIVDVSDILTFTSGANDIVSGTVNTTTSLADPNITELIIVNLNFDDTFITNNVGDIISSDLTFSVRGLDSVKTNDSTPNQNTNKYKEKTGDKVENAVGEGQSGGTPLVISGGIHGNRKATLDLTPPPSS